MERRSFLVYAGSGSSHSWTWLADLFESRGIHDVQFVDTNGFTEQLTDQHSAVVISGGDGFAIASAVGKHGFSHLKGFIHRGGRYIGMCAGAYLPLPSSLEPFNSFNVSGTKIENLEDNPDSSKEESPRIAVRYGGCSVVHPVRGELELEYGKSTVRAPLYGGPVFREPTTDEVIARYKNLTDRTELQMDRSRVLSLISGKPAVIRSKHGQGDLLLFGPHLEHPRFPEANDLFLKIIGLRSETVPGFAGRPLESQGSRFVERALADLKVAILGLENRSFLVGNKLWDGSRFLELVMAIEKRYHTADETLSDAITENLNRARAEILKARPETLLYADEGPERLVETTRLVVDNHFRMLRESRNR